MLWRPMRLITDHIWKQPEMRRTLITVCQKSQNLFSSFYTLYKKSFLFDPRGLHTGQARSEVIVVCTSVGPNFSKQNKFQMKSNVRYWRD